uniref:Uncharacterized protein n=1 Tax=Rhizophora mucronata TaxID=61149 RepID=A0A2P2NN37_RHIMU
MMFVSVFSHALDSKYLLLVSSFHVFLRALLLLLPQNITLRLSCL